ncbi:MAG: trehalase family glycosidase [Phycisphaerae bacterium]
MAMRTTTALAAAAAWTLAASASAAGAGGYTFPPPEHVPGVFGPGIVMAYSGLDGETHIEPPVVATLAEDGLTLQFHLEGEPALELVLPDRYRLRWRVVTSDLLLADVIGDDLPLVVAFSAWNVVVGRLPPGSRAGLRGSGAGTVLMRDRAGDRIRFAFACNPLGPRRAARDGSQGLKVSLETLIESRLDFFAEAPHGSENLEPDRAETLAKAFSVMKANTYSPETPIAVRWTTPARWPYRHQNPWASAFHALGLMHLDTAAAKEALAAVYATATPEGMIPGRSGPATSEEVAQPPMLARAAWAVYRHERMRDRRFLRASFDVVAKQMEWFLRNRRLGGPPPPEKPLTFGVPLYAWASAEEAAMPGSPRFASGAAFAAVDLSTYIAAECRTLQTMAQALGYGVSARTWGRRADAVAAAVRRHLWRAEAGFFFDRTAPDGEWVEVWSAAGLAPLALGVADDAQAARLLEHLGTDRFRTPAGVATLGSTETAADGQAWTGGVWMPLNYLLVRGLQTRGETEAARDLAERTLAAVTRRYHEAGTLDEFYPARASARGAGAADIFGGGAAGRAERGARDYFPTAAVFADLVLRPKP